MFTLRAARTTLASISAVAAATLGLALVPASAPTASPAATPATAPAATVLAGAASSAATVNGVVRRAAPRRAALGSASYAFASVVDDQPVRWNPCAPIRWTSNTTRGPAGGLDVLKASVARIAATTGTTWQYVGPTSTVPTSGYLPGSATAAYPPVLLGWTDGAASDMLRSQPRSVLGMTRSAWFGVQKPDGRKIVATRAAVVALDRTDALPLRGGTSWTSVVLHELGHAMGLAHTPDSSQLMATVLPRTLTDLQAGDRAGLTRLGRTAGCIVL